MKNPELLNRVRHYIRKAPTDILIGLGWLIVMGILHCLMWDTITDQFYLLK